MTSVQTIIDISLVCWLLPPFRQFKGRFFYYFLIMALSDPINIFCLEVIKTPLYSIHSAAGLLLIISLIFNSDGFRNKTLVIFPLISGFTLGLIYLTNFLYLLLILHIIIFLLLLKIAILPIYQKNIINLFYFVLLFYELSIVLNLTLITGSSNIKIILFFSTLFFQVLIALFFTIFTEKSKFLIISIK